MFFKKSLMNLIANQTKYGETKAANVIIDQWNHGYKSEGNAKFCLSLHYNGNESYFYVSKTDLQI